LSRIYSNNIPAYTGVVLRSSKAGEFTITEADEDARLANINGNILIDTADGEVELTNDNAYTFGVNNKNVLAFYSSEAGVTVPQYSAYFVLDGAKSASVLSLSFDDDPEVSGIEDVNAEDAEVEYYNLQGVKVENPEKGIYIMKQGGKTSKVVL
jgi:hypothetical protein